MDNGASSYRRFLDGDDEGIAELVREYRAGLTLYLTGIVGSVHIAEELCEDTFFRLMIKKPEFSGKSSFKTWLYTIARNLAVDRARHRSKLSDTPIDELDACLADESDLEKEYIKKEDRITVHRAMTGLNSDYRQVLWLICFEELSGDEAAEVMKKDPRQIRNLLYRAKQALKKELEKEGFDYED